MGEKEKQAIENFVNDATDDEKMLILSLIPSEFIVAELSARLDDLNELKSNLIKLCEVGK